MKKILTVILMASLLLASCGNASTTTESSESSVETSVNETNESVPESSSSKSSEEPESGPSSEATSEEVSTTAAGDNIFTVAFSCTDSVISPARPILAQRWAKFWRV